MSEELDVLRIISERLAAGGVPFMLTGSFKAQRMFNLMHLSSGIKVDLIVRKSSEYRQLEFDRRRPVDLAGVVFVRPRASFVD